MTSNSGGKSPKGTKSALGSLLNPNVASGSGVSPKIPALVSPMLQEVGKLAAGVASVSTKGPITNSSGSATGNPRNKCALQPGHSLMDWIRLGASGKDLTGVGAQAGHLSVTEKELAHHKVPTDAWLVIRGKVFNVTEYLPFHPGGPDELMKGAGKDATSLFEQVHPWVNYEQILQKCFVGRLVSIDPSIDKETLFFGTQPRLVQSPNNNSLLPRESEEEFLVPPSASLPRFDWIQKLDFITIIFYTQAFCNPLLEIFQSPEDQTILILLTYEDTVHSNEIVFHKEVVWPCQIKITCESGKIEMVFRKKSGDIWDNYGVLRQTNKATGAATAGIVQYTYVVTEKASVNHNTFLLKLERNDGSKLIVPVGKHVRCFAKINSTEITRSYTPVPESVLKKLTVNAPSSDSICLMVKRYPTGNLSKYLNERSVGDVIHLSKPIGDFELKNFEKRETFLLLAAGTGITPMLSLIVFLLERRVKKCQFARLLFFNKTEEDILLKNQLEQLQSEDKRLRIDFILSQPSDTWQGPQGHITTDLVSKALEQHIQDTGYTIKNIYACVCGPNAFTALSMDVLKQVGLSPEQIHAFQG